MEKQTEVREYKEGSPLMLMVNWRVRRPDCEEVVQIVEEWLDSVVGDQGPVYGGGNGVEQEGSGTQAKIKNQIDEEVLAPAHAEKIPVCQVDGDVAICRFHVKLGHECPRTKRDEMSDSVVHGYVMHGVRLPWDAVVDSGTMRGGQIEDEAPPPGLAALWNNAKRADLQIA